MVEPAFFVGEVRVVLVLEPVERVHQEGARAGVDQHAPHPHRVTQHAVHVIIFVRVSLELGEKNISAERLDDGVVRLPDTGGEGGGPANYTTNSVGSTPEDAGPDAGNNRASLESLFCCVMVSSRRIDTTKPNDPFFAPGRRVLSD